MGNIKGPTLQLVITISSESAYLLFGYDQVRRVLGGLASDPSFLSAMENPSPTYLGIIVALFNIGCLGGCLIAALWGNHLGRKKSIASPYGSGQMITGRIISGIGNGMNTSTVSVYVSETSRSAVRGRFLAIQMSTVIFGTVVAYWLDYGMIAIILALALQEVFALITVATMHLLPESPRRLYSKDKRQEAVRSLSLLMDLPDDHREITSIVSEIDQAISLEASSSKLSFRGIFLDKSDRKNRRRLLRCLLLQLFQQFTSINVIMFYMTMVLEIDMGLSRELSSPITRCIQIAFWAGTFPAIILIDRLGRRRVPMYRSTMLCIAMVLFTTSMVLQTPASSRLAVGMLIIYEFSFGMSWNSVPWLYALEITPLNLHHLGTAVECISQWLWLFVIAVMTPSSIENTWKIYLLFCLMLALGVLFVYLFMPETNGKSLEEIDYIFVKDRGQRGPDPIVPRKCVFNIGPDVNWTNALVQFENVSEIFGIPLE
ncbi:general substrate transporter [Aspergillus aurantiobrunneus]